MSALPRVRVRRGVRQFIKFGVVGASGALVNFIIYHALLHVGVAIWFAYAVGFIAGGVNNYWWNRQWTFRSKGHPWKELGQFISVSAISLGLSEIVISILHAHLPFALPFRNSVIWVCATVAGMGLNFFANKYWTFRHTHHVAADTTT